MHQPGMPFVFRERSKRTELYAWYLDILGALKADEPLVPQEALDWVVAKGLIRRIGPEEVPPDYGGERLK